MALILTPEVQQLLHEKSLRDKLVSHASDLWETPPAIYAQLVKDFGPFHIDLTADPQRALCPIWFGPGEGSHSVTALMKTSWRHFGMSGYSNPPYGPFVPKLLAKAFLEAHLGFSTTLLLPLRVTKAFRTYVLQGASELWFCDRRICFYEQGEPRWNQKTLAKTGKYRPDPALFDSIIVRYLPRPLGAHVVPVVGEWHVPSHV